MKGGKSQEGKKDWQIALPWEMELSTSFEKLITFSKHVKLETENLDTLFPSPLFLALSMSAGSCFPIG